LASRNEKSLVTVIVISAAAGVLIAGLAALGAHLAVALTLGLIGAAVLCCAIELCLFHTRWPTQRDRLKRAANEAASASAAPWFDRTLSPRLPLPSLSGWALEPEAAGYLVQTIRTARPDLVLELGSGVSTLLAAYALERNDAGRVYSFDAEEGFAERTRQLLRLHGLEHRAEVRHAPLQALETDGWTGRWFDTRAFATLPDAGVDLLIVDGPPRRTGRQARYPALPVLRAKLQPGATVILDDADRAEERETVERWQASGLVQPSPRFPVGTGVAVMRAPATHS